MKKLLAAAVILMLALALPNLADAKRGMRIKAMYVGPDIKQMAEKLGEATLCLMPLNPVDDIVNYDPSIIAWTLRVVWEEGGEVKTEPHLALRYGVRDEAGRQILVTLLPKPRSYYDGKGVFIEEHCGTKAYNSRGEAMDLESSWTGNLKMGEKFKAFVGKITPDSPYIIAIQRDSPEMVAIIKAAENLGLRSIGEEALKLGYGQAVTALTPDQLRAVASQSEGARRWLEWLFDWHISVGIPIGSAETIAFNALLTKAFSIPELFSRTLNHKGCLKSRVCAEDVAGMILYHDRTYRGR